MSESTQSHHGHVIDHETSKLGMWVFIFTEILLFGGLFITYAVYRFLNKEEFFHAGQELDTTIGAINTVVLLVSSMTIAMSITAIQKSHKKLSIWLMVITIFLALVFMVNKYFEWSIKFEHGIYPGSEYLESLPQGEILFFGLYFMMTGLHALHVIVGVIFIAIIMGMVIKNKIHKDKFALLENSGLYWHLVDLIWIFLFPLFYLIA